MKRTPRTWPTFAAELLAARAALRLPTEVGLAIRADRRRLGLSQRSYATRRRLTAAMVARLESRAGDLKLADVIRGLEGTPFMLCLCHRPDEDDSGALAQLSPSDQVSLTDGQPSQVPPEPVSARFWPREELVARVRSGTRRFPAHHTAWQVDRPPLWWWYAEATYAYAKPPHWYAPRPGRSRHEAS
jgi:hypothetical protein